jgi:FKBP-type peptidyl-prolyl cis-trans isomerase FklB
MIRKGIAVVALFMMAFGAVPSPARAADATPSLAANQAFLAANSKKPGVISRPDGLQYRVLRAGLGPRPVLGDMAQIVYSGHLINGTSFDGSSPGLPVSLSVGSAIRGLNEALLQMHVGDHWEIVIPPDLAFGASGATNGAVPPNQALVFDLALVSRTSAAGAAAGSDGHISISPFNRRDSATSQSRGAVLTIPQ